MAEILNVDLCVIGAGSGGLSVAAGAVQMGASVVLVERHKMGGDCLNYGCVPSKSLIAAGRAAEATRRAGRFGIDAGDPIVDFARVHDHVHGVIAAIAPHDSVARFEGLGVKVIQAEGRFTGPRELAAGDQIVRARRFVIATGSSPGVPPIPGLDRVAFDTNETIFLRQTPPEHLIVIGGGPIGLELAQAHRHLGVRVSVIEAFSILGKEDPELVAILRDRVLADGVELHEAVAVKEVAAAGAGIAVTVGAGGERRRIEGSHLLVAAGRTPNLGGLDLDAARVAHTPKGIEVDRRMRSSNRRIFAIGDAAGAFQFTHAAAYHADIVIRNALFRLPAKVNYQALPWVTFTTPEHAHVGMTEEDARAAGHQFRVLRAPFADNDRARAERETDGLVKVVVTRKGRILGASILGPHAGELIHIWTLAIRSRLKIGAVAGMIAPYPTFGETSKRAAGSFYTEMLFGSRTRRLVRFLGRFG